jgi:hypothetical protein
MLTDWVRQRGTRGVDRNSLPHQYFLMFQTKVLVAFDLLFSEENVFPPFGSGEN